MKKQFILALAALVAGSFATSAHAQILNLSFEAPAATSPGSPFDITPNSNTAAALIPGWTAAMSDPNNENSYGVVNNSTLISPGTSDGNQSAIMQVYFNFTNSTLTSTFSAPIQPNSTYTLTVAVGAPATPTTFDGVGGTVGESAASGRISLLANGVPFATTGFLNTAVTQGTLTDYTLTFSTGTSDAILGQQLTIQLEADKAFYPGDAADPGDESLIFDNVRLEIVPEPSTWALMLGGSAVLGLAIRRKSLKA